MADEFAATAATATPAAAGPEDRPGAKSAAYERMEPRWDRCRAFMEGTDGVRALEEDALPRFEDESDDSYKYRKQLAAVSNGFARTVFACVGLITQQEPKLGDDMPEKLTTFWQNVDSAGTHGAVFTRELLINGMVDGHAGILVDYPRVDNAKQVDRDMESRLGLRPYWNRVEAPDIYLMLYEPVNGVRTLTLLVIREVVQERDGRYGVADVTRFRVYLLEGTTVTAELWEVGEGEKDVSKVGQPITMTNVSAIPFVFFPAGRVVGPGETMPPLVDLADLCLEHHQIKTEIRNLESLAMIPTTVRIGASKDENDQYPPLPRGPRAVIEAPKIDGVDKPIYWDTPDTTVLDPAMKSLANNEAAQGAAGLAFLTPETRAAETAEAKRIDSTAQNATLASVARNLKDALETAFDFTAEFMSSPSQPVKAGSITLNTDFENTVLDAPTITALGSLAANGKLSLETLLGMLVKGKRLPDGFDVQAEVRRIISEGSLPAEQEPAVPASEG